MTGRIASDCVAPARRTLRVDFTADEIVDLLKTRAAFVADINTAAQGVAVRCANGMHAATIEISYDMPAATPAPLPLTLDFPCAAPASAPPPAPPTERLLFWWEFPLDGVAAFTEWGHGLNEADAYLDACARRQGDPGELLCASVRTLVEPPGNVTPLHYAFSVPGHTMVRHGFGCTPQQAWDDVVGREAALAHVRHTVVVKSRTPLPPALPMPLDCMGGLSHVRV